MSTDIVDLDALIPADKKASLGGVTYTVPGDLPMEVFLKMQRAGQLQEDEDVDEAVVIHALRDTLFTLFSWNIPEAETEKRAMLERTLNGLGIRTFMKLFSELYKVEDDAETDGDSRENPTPEAEDGTASTKPSLELVPEPTS